MRTNFSVKRRVRVYVSLSSNEQTASVRAGGSCFGSSPKRAPLKAATFVAWSISIRLLSMLSEATWILASHSREAILSNLINAQTRSLQYGSSLAQRIGTCQILFRLVIVRIIF